MFNFDNTVMGKSLEMKKVEMVNDGFTQDEAEEFIYDLSLEISLVYSNMTYDEYTTVQENKFNNWYDQRQQELSEELPF